MANQNIITDIDPYSKEQLGMYFDPFIYKHIKELKLDGVNINKFIIVFWDISKFSSLIKELKALMKKPRVGNRTVRARRTAAPWVARGVEPEGRLEEERGLGPSALLHGLVNLHARTSGVDSPREIPRKRGTAGIRA
jgi:hypothetical protein